MNANVIGTVYTTDRFFWNKESRIFSAEISEVPQVLRQLYNDSMDIGFAMFSVKTKNIAEFTLKQIRREAVVGEIGDVASWVFEPTPLSIRKNAKLDGVLVIIFND